MRALVVLVLLAARASAATLHGLVFDDRNGDGHPTAGEPGVANAVVAFGVEQFVTTDASGQFELRVPDDRAGILWVRVPDGFRPGPVWTRWDPAAPHDAELALHRLAVPIRGPVTFVVAADTHLQTDQVYFGAKDLALAADEATALDPPPAFFTILGDITHGNQDEEFDLVDGALGGLDVPWIPVPGNHDWYDDGETWFRRYGPDNYSFDIADVHFVVWNMAMSDDEIRAYLGAELRHVARGMTIVALTHAPPSPEVIDALRELGVAYVLTGHAHSNRVVDHDGVIELNTEPLLMGGLDFTPAGYRVITIADGKLDSYHRTMVDAPALAVVGPARGACAPRRGGELVVAAELDAGDSRLAARIDCATPLALRYAGGWTWRAALPALEPGPHELEVTAQSATGRHAELATTIDACDPPAPPPAGDDWPQLGGGPSHDGARPHVLAPPLVPRWTAAVGGHVVTAPPAIAGGTVYVAVTDLGDGATGGVVAIELATGAIRWRAATARPVRGGVAIVPGAPPTVVVAQIDGAVLGLDAATGAVRWRYELSIGVAPQAGAVFGSPAADGGDVLIGHQRALAALAGATGTPLWTIDPVPEGADSQSAVALAIGDGVAVGAFNRRFGGLLAWDRATGAELWRLDGPDFVAINASPVIAGDTVYAVSGADAVFAVDLASGAVRWRSELDPAGFAWGNATIGTPALAHGVLVVPTLYRDVVALDAASGAELWRGTARPGPLRTTHYRGARTAGFEASPIITGDVVWTADTSGQLVARALQTGEVLWQTELDTPVLAGLAASGDWLVVASYDGSVRALAPGAAASAPAQPACNAPVPGGGCCDAGGASGPLLAPVVAAMLLRRRRR
ncbi:MAG TPA: PQQ-binding-like beta-propeller repeat protein [Kofleriaceae bacterium]|nr:PQQ-binding-like beta-propeller repeat protein [Kofleriaceae bacterium]